PAVMIPRPPGGGTISAEARRPATRAAESAMRTAPLLSGILLLAAATAQVSTSASDVGLTLTGLSTANAAIGQVCGAFSCTPFTAPAVAAGSTRVITHWGAAGSPFVIAISLLPATPMCLPFGGIGNAVVLDLPPVTLAIGATLPTGPSTTVCQVTQGRATLVMPAGLP